MGIQNSRIWFSGAGRTPQEALYVLRNDVGSAYPSLCMFQETKETKRGPERYFFYLHAHRKLYVRIQRVARGYRATLLL